MSPPSVYQRLSAPRASGPAVLLRLVLLLAAWQGPIPWCHNHATGVTAESTTWLIEHLKSHHRSVEPQCQAACHQGLLGWHFHADFPMRPAGDEGSQPGQLPSEFPASTISDVRIADASGNGRLLTLSPRLSAEPGPADAWTTALANSPVSFFDGYAATLPLPLRFCILRC